MSGPIPDVLQAICDEAKSLGMKGVVVDLKVSETDGVIASNAGVRSIEHWYGIPAAGKPYRRGGVRWTIKNGVVFDAKTLLAEVQEYVSQAKTQPTASRW